MTIKLSIHGFDFVHAFYLAPLNVFFGSLGLAGAIKFLRVSARFESLYLARS